MFRIGEFSKLARVSPRMLRHYEKCGLFFPAETDPFTGYRLYSAAQMPALSQIGTLREMGFSIEETRALLPQMEDSAALDKALRAKMAEVKASIDAEEHKLMRLWQMSDNLRRERKIMLYDVELKKLPAVKVIALRGVIPHYRDEGMLWERLSAFVAQHQVACCDGGISIFYDDEYKEENPDVEIAIPVKELGKSEGAFVYKELPAVPLAATLKFSGPFDGGYDAASERLAAWMEENGYAFAGNMRGQIITGPDVEPDMEKWMTELQVPVVKK